MRTRRRYLSYRRRLSARACTRAFVHTCTCTCVCPCLSVLFPCTRSWGENERVGGRGKEKTKTGVAEGIAKEARSMARRRGWNTVVLRTVVNSHLSVSLVGINTLHAVDWILSVTCIQRYELTHDLPRAKPNQTQTDGRKGCCHPPFLYRPSNVSPWDLKVQIH